LGVEEKKERVRGNWELLRKRVMSKRYSPTRYCDNNDVVQLSQHQKQDPRGSFSKKMSLLHSRSFSSGPLPSSGKVNTNQPSWGLSKNSKAPKTRHTPSSAAPKSSRSSDKIEKTAQESSSSELNRSERQQTFKHRRHQSHPIRPSMAQSVRKSLFSETLMHGFKKNSESCRDTEHTISSYDYSNLLIEAKLNILCGSFEEHTHFTYARTVNLLHLSFMIKLDKGVKELLFVISVSDPNIKSLTCKGFLLTIIYPASHFRFVYKM
jgi:hypothetical protein